MKVSSSGDEANKAAAQYYNSLKLFTVPVWTVCAEDLQEAADEAGEEVNKQSGDNNPNAAARFTLVVQLLRERKGETSSECDCRKLKSTVAWMIHLYM